MINFMFFPTGPVVVLGNCVTDVTTSGRVEMRLAATCDNYLIIYYKLA